MKWRDIRDVLKAELVRVLLRVLLAIAAAVGVGEAVVPGELFAPVDRPSASRS